MSNLDLWDVEIFCTLDWNFEIMKINVFLINPISFCHFSDAYGNNIFGTHYGAGILQYN